MSPRKIIIRRLPSIADKFSCKNLVLPRYKSTVIKKFKLTMLILSTIIAGLLHQSFSSFYCLFIDFLVFQILILSVVYKVLLLMLLAAALVRMVIKSG